MEEAKREKNERQKGRMWKEIEWMEDRQLKTPDFIPKKSMPFAAKNILSIYLNSKLHYKYNVIPTPFDQCNKSHLCRELASDLIGKFVNLPLKATSPTIYKSSPSQKLGSKRYLFREMTFWIKVACLRLSVVGDEPNKGEQEKQLKRTRPQLP